MPDISSRLLYYFDAGGIIVAVLFAGMLVLWYALGYRWSTVKRGKNPEDVRTMVDQALSGEPSSGDGVIEQAIGKALQLRALELMHLRRHLDDAFWEYEQTMSRYRVLTKTIVSTAPLLGLLGTVTGMIETFRSLQDMALFAQSGGIAGGISQALITTQFGLAVAIPGLIVNGLVERRRRTLQMELDQVKDIVTSLR